MACLCTGALDGGYAGRLPFSEPGLPANHPPDRAARITHAAITLHLEPADATFSGEAVLSMEATRSFDGQVVFDLADVTVLAVEADGKPLEYVHADEELRIDTDTVPANIRVTWKGANPRRGLYFTGPNQHSPDRTPMAWTQCQDADGHFVFPCHDHPASKHPWTLSLSAPEGHTLLSNGEQTAKSVEDGRVTAVYEMRDPMPAYLVTFVAARLEVFDAEWRGRSVRYLVPEGRGDHALSAMGKTPAMMEHFSTLFGVDYPWPRYDQVVVDDFIFGGMENSACTTMTSLLLVDDRGRQDWSPEPLVAHELAHQWFGDLVTCEHWSQGWLNESWATYCEALWFEHERPDYAQWHRYVSALGYFGEAQGRYRRPIVSTSFREPIDVFDRHLYNKGGAVLWTLRDELGDEAFFAGVNRYLETHKHSTVHTRDFQRALEAESGRNLEAFFGQWIHSPGHPELTVKLTEENGLVVVDVKQTQTGDDVPDAFTLGLRIEVVTDQGTRAVRLPVTQRESVFAVPLDGALKCVRIDPGLRVLADIKLAGAARLLLPLLQDECPVLVIRAAAALLDGDSWSNRGAVVGAAQSHPHFGVRCALWEQLGKRKEEAVADGLLVALDEEQDARVQRGIVRALGHYREERVVAALLKRLHDGVDTWQLEGDLLHSLGKMRSPDALDALKAGLNRSSWAEFVRQRAVAGLAASRQEGVVTDLIDASRALPDRARQAVPAGLVQAVKHNPEVRGAIVERLCDMLSEPGFRTQLSAASALGKLGDQRALGALGAMHRRAPDGRTRRSAYEAIARIRKGAAPESGLHDEIATLQDNQAKLAALVEKLSAKVES